jgi:hypothetical protein
MGVRCSKQLAARVVCHSYSANCEFAHGWWNFAEFLQLLSNDFACFDFGVLLLFDGDPSSDYSYHYAGCFGTEPEARNLF